MNADPRLYRIGRFDKSTGEYLGSGELSHTLDWAERICDQWNQFPYHPHFRPVPDGDATIGRRG